jgi:E3 ubiquitin-protein ligase TRIP12
MLARQLKLRLVAEEDSGIPKSCSNVVVSIHAIATFQAFNDYLRPRILAATGQVGGRNGGAGRLAGLLDAFAAATGGGSRADDSAGSEGAIASGSGSAPSSVIKQEEGDTSAAAGSASASASARRRSRRLSGKDGDEVVNTTGVTSTSGSVDKGSQQECVRYFLDLNWSN